MTLRRRPARLAWFSIEVLGGEDVSPEQVERAMNAQAAANKTRDQDAEFIELLDGIFMEPVVDSPMSRCCLWQAM